MTQRIFVMSPESTWDSDRLENLMYLIFHQYPDATIVEQRDTQVCPKGVATIIFIRDENRCIDLDLWTMLTQAAASGKNVKLARMDRDQQLVLVGWKQLSFDVQDDGHFKVGYAKPARREKQKVEAKA